MPINVDFYLLSNLSMRESRPFICRLTEKIYKKQHQLYIHTPSLDEAQQLNDSLWTFRDISFIPHSLYEENPETETPILIGHTVPQIASDILINLTSELPDFYTNFERILEIIPADLKAAGRKKYKFYRDQDCELKVHNIT